MKNTLFAAVLLLSFVASATSFEIGNHLVELEFDANPTNEAFRLFVAEDVSRVFAPLGDISNVLDIASFQQHPDQPLGLAFHECYPEGFFSGWSLTNRNGTLVFRMKQSLSCRYMESFNGFSSISNRVAELNALVESINNGTITNQTDGQILSLVFVPENSSFSFTPAEVRAFFGDMSRSGPFTISILDLGMVGFQGPTSLIAVAKTARLNENGMRFVPVSWIFKDDCWVYCHPAVFDSLFRE